MNRFGLKLALVAALACFPSTLLAQARPAADTPGRTSSGVAYTQPKDWGMTVQGGASVFVSPEENLSIAVVDAGNAASAQAAAAKAWSIYKPAAGRTVRLAAAGPPGDGWDERVSFAYETSPSEKAAVSALALRSGTAWTVVIVDGAESTMNKRAAAAALIEASLRPAGYVRETFAGKTAHRLTPERIQALRDFIAQSAQSLEVPGVGIALIDQGKVVFEGGYGVRELGQAAPVDAHTKFMIASNTKGMTTLLLSVLADEGKLKWDQKVTDLYPSFRLGSDGVTKSVEVRHLVCACTGLPRRDYAFILGGSVPASDTFRQLSETEPTSKFGELYQYSNLMAAAAGYLGGSLAYPKLELGAAYDKAMQTRVFGPLGMADTTFDFKVGESGDWAHPHGYDIDGRVVEMSNHFNHLITPYRPAGGAWSSAADMARYVQLELGKGVTPPDMKGGGKRLVSEANILERRQRGVPTGEDAWYGMGLMNDVVSGVQVVTHGGTLQGFHSDWWALPEAGIGAVLLTNSDTGPAMFEPFLRRLMEIAYDGKPEAAQQVASAAQRLKTQSKARRTRLTVPGDPAVLAALAPTYRDAELGNTITIHAKDGAKWVDAGFIEGPLATRKNADGSVSIVSIGPGSIGVDALVGARNGARTLTIHDSQHDYVYVEQR